MASHLPATVALTLTLLVAVTFAGLVAGGGCSKPAVSSHPNVVLVTLDTLAVSWTGPYNSAVTNTPVLDRFARRGVTFDNAYTSVPITLPAHASLLSGRPPWETGALDNGQVVDDRLETLPELLRAQGYRTAAFVSLGVLEKAFGLDQGFDFYDDGALKDPGRWYLTAEEVVSKASEWIAATAPAPFFVWVHLSDPHEPYVAPDAPIDLLLELDGESVGSWTLAERRGETARLRITPGRHLLKWTSLRTERPDDLESTSLRLRLAGADQLTPWIDAEDIERLQGEVDLARPLLVELDHRGDETVELEIPFRGRLKDPAPSEVLAAYGAEIAHADRQLGRLEDSLSALGLAEDTLWILLSDHGEGLYHHGILGHANFAYEDQLRVLWILAGPKLPAARRIGARGVLTEDVAPTVLDLLGLEVPTAVTGRSQLDCIQQGDCSSRLTWWAYGTSGSGAIEAIAGYRWPFKTLNQEDPHSGCYRVEDDPLEANNLCKLYSLDRSLLPDEVKWLERESPKMTSLLQARLDQAGASELDSETLEMLRALGYVAN